MITIDWFFTTEINDSFGSGAPIAVSIIGSVSIIGPVSIIDIVDAIGVDLKFSTVLLQLKRYCFK